MTWAASSLLTLTSIQFDLKSWKIANSINSGGRDEATGVVRHPVDPFVSQRQL